MDWQQSEVKQSSQLLINSFANKHIGFEKNNGQFSSNILYRLGSSNANVDFFENKILFSLRKETCDFDPRDANNPLEFEYVNWEIELLNSHSFPKAIDLKTINKLNSIKIKLVS